MTGDTRQGLAIRTRLVGYEHSLHVQAALADLRRAGAIPDVIWVLEHPPVYTVGRHGAREDLFVSDDHLAALGASFHRVDRGGQMTWHGPGQTTVYVIRDLRPAGRIRDHVDALVGAMGDAAAAAGLDDTVPGTDAMGLYAAGRKLGSVGVRVKRGITTHGLALNRNPDPMWFTLMTACGAPEVEATSIAAEGGRPGREDVDAALAGALGRRLGLDLTTARLADLPLPAALTTGA